MKALGSLNGKMFSTRDENVFFFLKKILNIPAAGFFILLHMLLDSEYQNALQLYKAVVSRNNRDSAS